jgi:hypothetical protein
MNEALASKSSTITILAVLLAIAVILAIIGFARKRKVVSS